MNGQAMIWYYEFRLEDARSEALRALEIFEKLEAARCVRRDSKSILELIHDTMESGSTSKGSDSDGGFRTTILPPISANHVLS